MALYGGDLLPEEGPAEWVVEPREHYRAAAVEVAREAAEAALLDGDARTAIEACRAGLAIDRYHDPLWRLLIEARQAAGDVSAANRDRREYEAILSSWACPRESPSLLHEELDLRERDGRAVGPGGRRAPSPAAT